MGFYTMEMSRSGFLFNVHESEWVGVGFYTRMGRSGFLFNVNESEWLGVGFYTRNGSQWVFIKRKWVGVARSIKMVMPKYSFFFHGCNSATSTF